MSISTSSAPNVRNEFGQKKIPLLFLEHSNVINSKIHSIAFNIAKYYSPLIYVQGYSMPPFSSVLMNYHTVTSLNDFKLLQTSRQNGVGYQGIIECLGYLYDLCIKIEEKNQDTHQKTDDLDDFLIEMDDQETGNSDIIKLDEDLNFISGINRNRAKSIDTQQIQEYWRNSIPKILLLTLENPTEFDFKSSGLWSLLVRNGTHSNGKSFLDLFPILMKYMDIIVLCSYNQMLKLKTASQKYFNIQKWEDDLYFVFNISKGFFENSILSIAIQEFKSSTKQDVNSGTKQNEHNMIWDGQLKYHDKITNVSAYVSKSINLKADEWPKEFDLSGDIWHLTADNVKQLFKSHSNTLCQWLIKDKSVFAELFQTLYKEEGSIVCPLRVNTYLFFMPKSLFTRIVQNPQDESQKPHFVSFIITKQDYEELSAQQRKYSQNVMNSSNWMK